MLRIWVKRDRIRGRTRAIRLTVTDLEVWADYVGGLCGRMWADVGGCGRQLSRPPGAGFKHLELLDSLPATALTSESATSESCTTARSRKLPRTLP
jgi:hypothetical protein